MDVVEYLFTAYDGDYSFGADIPEAAFAELAGSGEPRLAEGESARSLLVRPDYYNQKNILLLLQNQNGFCYWDLLFQCLEERELSDFNNVVQSPQLEENFLTFLVKTASDRQLKLIEELVIHNQYNLLAVKEKTLDL